MFFSGFIENMRIGALNNKNREYKEKMFNMPSDGNNPVKAERRNVGIIAKATTLREVSNPAGILCHRDTS